MKLGRKTRPASDDAASLEQQLAATDAALPALEEDEQAKRARLESAKREADEAEQDVAAAPFEGDPAEAERRRGHAVQELAAAEAAHDDAVRTLDYGRKRRDSIREEIRASYQAAHAHAIQLLQARKGAKLAEVAEIDRAIEQVGVKYDSFRWPEPTAAEIEFHYRMALQSRIPVAMQRIDNPRLRRAVEAAVAAYSPEHEREATDERVRQGALSVRMPNGAPAYRLQRPREAGP